MWELDRHPWDRLRANGSAKTVPGSIASLLAARDARSANEYYWRIDNTVVVQGALFESALPVAECLVVGLQGCAPTARVGVLELLVQIAGGEAAPVEVEAGNLDLAGACGRELRHGLAIFLHILETGTEDERVFCVDLLGLTARACPDLRDRVRWYLARYAAGDVPPPIQALVASWIAELEEGGAKI